MNLRIVILAPNVEHVQKTMLVLAIFTEADYLPDIAYYINNAFKKIKIF